MYICLQTLTHTLILWLKQLAALTKMEYSIYILILSLRARSLQVLFKYLDFLLSFFDSLPFPPSLGTLFIVSSSDSDAAPQFQGTLQAWRVVAAAISSENNCALKVDVTTSTCEALAARAVTAAEMNQINRLWLINQSPWIRNVRPLPFLLLPYVWGVYTDWKPIKLQQEELCCQSTSVIFWPAPPVLFLLISFTSIKHPKLHPPPFSHRSNYQSLSIIPYMDLSSNLLSIHL